MDILITIAKSTGGFIFSHARTYLVQEYAYLTSYKSNVENLEIEVQKLKEDEQHIAGDARRDHQEFQDWLEKVGGIIAHANKLINEDNEGHGEVRCLNIWPLPNVCLRLKLSKEAERMTQTVSRIIDEGRSLIASTQMTTSPFARDYEAMESRTSTLNEIKQALKDPNIYMIGVYRMGGAGKSTLVEELAWQVEKEGSFGVVVMVTSITNTPDLRRIQDQLADGLGLKFERESEKGRAGELRTRISSKKSILVILDDIWGELDLTELGVPYGDDHRGCKLVLTSRDCNVLNRMNTRPNFALEVLSEGESWNLFKKMAGNVVKQHTIKPVAVEVAKCCAGLPPSIVIVAKGLRKKNEVWAWKDSLKKLKQLDHKGSLMEQAYNRLKFSYDCLESGELKSLFLLIGCFELDGVDPEELFPICWGLGLYEVDTLAEARNRHYTLIDDLRASSLLLGRNTERVEMHEVHDVAKSIASWTHPTYAVKRYTKIKEWPKIDQLKKCHYIIVPYCYIDELPEKMECPELKLLLLENSMGNLTVPHDFFAGMREVKVLHLCFMMFIRSPLQSLRHLAKLRSLKLCDIEVEDIAIVGELTSLEILIVESAKNILELPKEITHLTQLRMLKFSSCISLRLIPKNLLSSLKCLEELYLHCPIIWEAEGRNNHNNTASLGELRNLDRLTALGLLIEDGSIFPSDLHNFEKLERYKIFVGRWFVGDPKFSRALMLRDSFHTNIVFKDWVKLLLTTVESLYLGELECVRNIFPDLNGDGFMKLRYLHIENSIGLLHIFNSISEPLDVNHAFPDLETLVLSNLENMEEICRGPLPAQSFGMLKVIKVKSCSKLKHLLLYSHIRHLSQLHKMKICGCESMTEIIAEEIQGAEAVVLRRLRSLWLRRLPKLLSFCLMPSTDGTGLVPLTLFDDKKVSMPNLETMKLSWINKCKIWDDNLRTYSCIQNLTRLQVCFCKRLTSLFPSSVSRALAKLKYLYIGNCDDLKTILVQEDISSEEVIFPNLETLRLYGLDNLKSLWPNQLAPNSYRKLNDMSIAECPKLLNAFPSYVLNNLQNLETLYVDDCNELEVIFEIQEHSTVATNQQGLATRLRDLTLCSLPKLKYIWSKDPHGILRFQSLCEVVVRDSKNLNHVFPISVAVGLQKLQRLDISDSGIENIVEKSESGEIKHVYLEDLSLVGCHRLKNIVPSSVVFQNLHELRVARFHEVANIMASSAATNLSKLRVLEISLCDDVEEIVASDNDDGDATSEIAFMKLEELKLRDLLRLRSFCRGRNYSFKFPSLKTLHVFNCPMMETFCNGKLTAPSLTGVTIPWPGPKNKDERWDGDLNTTIANIFTNKGEPAVIRV